MDTPNPVARYAHRNRLKRVVSLVTSVTDVHRILDYGCGSGAFAVRADGVNGVTEIGYTPFLQERVNEGP